jgi:hypothetical protein
MVTMIAILAKKVLELFTMLMLAASAAAYNRLLVLTGLNLWHLRLKSST